MRPSPSTIVIDVARCNGCGLCVRSCPTDALEVVAGRARSSGLLCVQCGHCQAICPREAVAHALRQPACTPFETFVPIGTPVPPGAADLPALVRLMASRRSIRRFSGQPVDPAQLRDLIRIAITAPSATNAQPWTFTILPDAAAVAALGRRVATVFERLCRWSDWRSVRVILRWLGKPQLDNFHRGYRQYFAKCLAAFAAGGPDPFFRGAPAVILASLRDSGSLHGEDIHHAVQNLLLAAHAMGLGTCLVGLALVAFRQDSTLAGVCGIPTDETVLSVLAIGHPDETYLRLTGRAEPVIRVQRVS